MIKRLTTVALAATLLLALGGAPVSASKPKPLGYIYEQCTTKTTCSFEASTNPQQNKIGVTATKLCVSGEIALQRAGFVTVKRGGKFSYAKTLSIENDYQKATVRVQLSGILKAGKKVTGSLEITTTASDCAADTGVKKSFKMKYIGPTYGG